MGGMGMQGAMNGKHVYPQRMEYQLRERGLVTDTFSVKELTSGRIMFRMKGRAFSMLHERKTLTDMDGEQLYGLREAVMSLHDRVHIIDPNTKQEIMTVKKKGFLPGFGAGTVLAWYGTDDSGPPAIEIQGNIMRKSFTIMDTASGRMMAAANRKSSISSVLLDNDTYTLVVEPGVDSALMVTLVVALDEIYND